MLNHGTSNKLLYIHNEIKCSYEKKNWERKDTNGLAWELVRECWGHRTKYKNKIFYLLWKEEGKIINTCDYTLSPALCVCVCAHTHKCALELQTNPIWKLLRMYRRIVKQVHLSICLSAELGFSLRRESATDVKWSNKDGLHKHVSSSMFMCISILVNIYTSVS